MNGVPIQIFRLTEGWVVSVSFQDAKEVKRYSYHAEDEEAVGKRVTKLAKLYEERKR